MTMLSAPPPALETLTVLLEAVTLDTMTPRLSLHTPRYTLAGFPVAATHATARLATSLPRPEALTVLGLAIGFDASAAELALGRHLFEEVVDLAIPWI